MKPKSSWLVLVLAVLLVGYVVPVRIAHAGEPMFWWRVSWAQMDETGRPWTYEELWAEEPTTVLESTYFGILHSSGGGPRVIGHDVTRVMYTADPSHIYRVDAISLAKDMSVGAFARSRWMYTCSPAPLVHISVGHYTSTVILTQPSTGAFRWSVDNGVIWWPLMKSPLVSKNDAGKLLVQKAGWDSWDSCLEFEWNSPIFRGDKPTPTATPTSTDIPTATPTPTPGWGFRLHGWVFFDRNRNGFRDLEEKDGPSGVEVQLKDSTGQVALWTKSVCDTGWYEFESVLVGEYELDLTLPDGYVTTTSERVRVVVPRGELDVTNFGIVPIIPTPTPTATPTVKRPLRPIKDLPTPRP